MIRLWVPFSYETGKNFLIKFSKQFFFLLLLKINEFWSLTVHPLQPGPIISKSSKICIYKSSFCAPNSN